MTQLMKFQLHVLSWNSVIWYVNIPQMYGHQFPGGEDASEVGPEPPALLPDGPHVCPPQPEWRGVIWHDHQSQETHR